MEVCQIKSKEDCSLNNDNIKPLNDGLPIAPQIYERLRAEIIKIELSPGVVISETETARKYGISRQPVREAFIKLAEAGLVQVRPQRGTMIARISREAVMDARFIREAIEADVVKLAAERCDAAAARELRDQIKRQEKGPALERDEFVRMDELFHQTLAEIAGRPHAWRTVEDLKAQMDRVRFLSVRNEHVKLLVIQHSNIAAAVIRNDTVGAEAAMREHLREILKSLPDLERDHPEFFTPTS